MGKREILESLGDFSNKEGWDKFFAGGQLDNPYEWYGDWSDLRDLLLSHLSASPTSQILVPGCGVSRLSENLYDAGFRGITNVDFAKVAISNMSGRNTRQRPYMRWRVMDMTNMQFVDESFDTIIDKGGLEALMEAEDGAMLANQYLHEVKRVTKSGGKFMCFTFAEPHVLGLLFSKLRFGWKTSIVAVESTKRPIYPAFMVVAEKADDSTALHHLVSSVNLSSLHFNATQANEFNKAIEKENKIREDLQFGDKRDLQFEDERDLQFGDKREAKNLHKHAWIKSILDGGVLEEAVACNI